MHTAQTPQSGTVTTSLMILMCCKQSLLADTSAKFYTGLHNLSLPHPGRFSHLRRLFLGPTTTVFSFSGLSIAVGRTSLETVRGLYVCTVLMLLVATACRARDSSNVVVQYCAILVNDVSYVLRPLQLPGGTYRLPSILVATPNPSYYY